MAAKKERGKRAGGNSHRPKRSAARRVRLGKEAPVVGPEEGPPETEAAPSLRFKLKERPVGFATHTAFGGETVRVRTAELLSPDDETLQQRLDQIQDAVLSQIPGLPQPSQIDHLVVTIAPDLTGEAYVNCLRVAAEVELGDRDIAEGDSVFRSDIKDIRVIDLGVELPETEAVIVIRSFGWRRSLYFDFSPLGPDNESRRSSLKHVLARQMLMLLKVLRDEDVGEDGQSRRTRVEQMEEGLLRLRECLSNHCQVEATYQALLQEHPWMLGGEYSRIDRHRHLDDERIPDFTGVRTTDGARDIFELKQPFLALFKKGDKFASAFNDAWNQAEEYLLFSRRQRSYLSEEKGLRMENPKCLLVLGYGLTERQLKKIREKEQASNGVRVWTYEHLKNTADHTLELVKAAGDSVG